jgi:transcription-repair coupling factor (superfamily II helicase)
MVSTVLTSFKNHHSLVLAFQQLCSEREVTVCGLEGSSSAFFAATFMEMDKENSRHPLLAVFPDEEEAEAFRGDIEELLGSEKVAYFPERDTSPYEHADSHFEVRSQRVETLDLLENGWHGIVVATVVPNEPSANQVSKPTAHPHHSHRQ